MPKIEQIICDRCSAVKKDQNNWWLATRSRHVLALQPLDPMADLVIYPERKLEKLYLCGEACVFSVFSDFMTGVHQQSPSAGLEIEREVDESPEALAKLQANARRLRGSDSA